MKNSKLMLMIVSVMLVAVMVLMPSQVKAVTNDKLAVVNASSDGNSSYLIYIDGLLNQSFRFALSNSADGTNLSYIDAATDDSENHVAYYDSTNPLFQSINVDQPVYLWVKGDTEKQALEVDLNNSITTSQLADVEKLTKIIPVTTGQLPADETQDENGVKITTIVDSVQIENPDKDAKYYYQMIRIPADDKYNNLFNLADQFKNEFASMTVDKQIKLLTDFYNLYNELIFNADWTEVENYTIEQPSDAEDGTQYILFLKKEGKDQTTYDVQFLTSAQEPFENYENVLTPSTVVTKRTSKLPITYDSMILWAVLAVIVIALIVVRSRMKKSKKESKH